MGALSVRETQRIARLLEQTFEGQAYYGPSVLGVLEHVTAEAAMCKPDSDAHSIWSLVAHMTAELRYTRALLEGSAEPWIEGQTTWPAVTDTSADAWRSASSRTSFGKPR